MDQMSTKTTNPLLECDQVILSERIGFRNDWNEIDAGSKTLHDLNVKRLQAVRILINFKGCSKERTIDTHVCPVGLMKYKQA